MHEIVEDPVEIRRAAEDRDLLDGVATARLLGGVRTRTRGDKRREKSGYFSRWTGSTHSTVSGFSTGSMSRLMATASLSLRTSTHSNVSSVLALIS